MSNLDSQFANVVGTWATLLSGATTSQCMNADDPTCTGGVAAVSAYLRNLGNGYPSFVFARADRYTAFVQMHPLNWNVNRLVLHDLMGWKVFASAPSILYAGGKEDKLRDLTDLRTDDMPLVLTNVAVPPSNPWYPYTKAIFFDDTTGLAVMSIADSGEQLNIPQIDAAIGMLDYVAKVNMESGCVQTTSDYWQYVNRTQSTSPRTCWIPLIYYADTQVDLFLSFLQTVMNYDNPPAIIIDVEGNDPSYSGLHQVGDKTIYVLSYLIDPLVYTQLTVEFNQDRTWIVNATIETRMLKALPPEFKDSQYASDIATLRGYANQALDNNPVVGQSTEMPITRIGNYRRCMAGECEIGNLFTDALRWKAQSNFAFITSGGIRGLGWPAGNVTVSDLWDSLPFANVMCTGTMSGVSVFKLFNYSTSIATFEGAVTVHGSELLQVSGIRVTYNTELNVSRLVGLDIWDEDQADYVPVDRLKLYGFATDNFLCGTDTPYPDLTGGDFVIEGEVPGKIVDILHQEIVAEYLTDLGKVYQAGIEGRLVNDTSITSPLDFIQSQGECSKGTYWLSEKQTCAQCPDTTRIMFTETELDFDGVTGSSQEFNGEIRLVNGENFTAAVVLKSVPSFVKVTEAAVNGTQVIDGFVGREPVALQAGENLALYFTASAASLEAGTAQGEISIGVSDIGTYVGCDGQDATFTVLMRVIPTDNLNQLGAFRSIGWSLAAVSITTALIFACWVFWNRQLRIVKTMQPIFLVTICFGVIIMASAMIPLSIDDGLVSQEGCDKSCMSTPWLLSIGFTVAFSGLFSKLWRINKLFHSQQFRRMKVRERDVLAPFLIMFTLNFAVLLSWTLIDPLRWERKAINGEPWNTYGTCLGSSGTAGTVFLILTGSINIGALLLAIWQAYRARNISDEFSESKSIAMALFGWVQLFVVGFPVLFMINKSDQTAKYFMQVGLLFAVCMSLLLFIFVPILVQMRKFKKQGKPSGEGRHVQVTGVYHDQNSYSNTANGFRNNTTITTDDSDPRPPGAVSHLENIVESAYEDVDVEMDHQYNDVDKYKAGSSDDTDRAEVPVVLQAGSNHENHQVDVPTPSDHEH